MQVTESCQTIDVCPVAAITALNRVARPSFALEITVDEEAMQHRGITGCIGNHVRRRRQSSY